MPNNNTVARAYVQIVPSAEGIKGSITSALGGEASSAGTKLGSMLSTGVKASSGGRCRRSGRDHRRRA